MTIDRLEVANFAENIVKEAGQLLLKMKSMPLKMHEKKDHADLVTIVDQKVEQFLVHRILEEYPEHGILGEEGTFEKDIEDFDTVWVIDPIDGTTNFIHGLPFFGISVGIIHKDEGVIGIVYNPTTDELFMGVKGIGAFLNDKHIHINSDLTLKNSLVSTSMFWQNVETKNALHENIIQLYKGTRGIRMVGGAAISLAEIPKGTFSAYIMPMLSPWDYAGGVIFLEQAGGIVSRLDGSKVNFKEGGSLLASHPSIHEELLKMF